MSEIRRTLERIERRVTMPEPAMERMLHRRERRERNERIEAAVVGLGVFAAGVVGAVLTLRVTGGTQPASGGGHPAASGGGGLVLPTVAIWTAIAVLALTAFATVRLRARFAGTDVEREGREPSGAAASACRPAAAPGTAPWKGGTEMDSKPTTGIRVPQPEMPGISFDDGKLRRTNRWLTGSVVVLALAVVALGTWVIVDRSSQPETVTAAEATRWIDASNAAMNAGDMKAYGATFAQDAVFEDRLDGEVLTGRDEIVSRAQANYLASYFYAKRSSEVVMAGDNVTVYGFTAGARTSDMKPLWRRTVGIMVVTFENGKAVHMVAFQPYPNAIRP